MEDKCAIRVQFYDKSKYLILPRENIAKWDIFIRAGKSKRKNRIYKIEKCQIVMSFISSID